MQLRLKQSHGFRGEFKMDFRLQKYYYYCRSQWHLSDRMREASAAIVGFTKFHLIVDANELIFGKFRHISHSRFKSKICPFDELIKYGAANDLNTILITFCDLNSVLMMTLNEWQTFIYYYSIHLNHRKFSNFIPRENALSLMWSTEV